MSKYMWKRGPINQDGDEELEYRWIREQTQKNMQNEFSSTYNDPKKAEAEAIKSWKAGHAGLDP